LRWINRTADGVPRRRGRSCFSGTGVAAAAAANPLSLLHVVMRDLVRTRAHIEQLRFGLDSCGPPSSASDRSRRP
jgi:hypothetical protein